MQSNDLNPETFYDIRDDATRAILMLTPQLLIVYSLSVGLLGAIIASFLLPSNGVSSIDWGYFWEYFLYGAGLGLLLALFHIYRAYTKSPANIAGQLGAEPLDSSDHYHNTFENVVEEICLPAPVDRVKPRVIPSSRTNALAVGDQEEAIVLITEGALGRLRRDELQAVVAHEMAHISYGDARLKSFTSAILQTFEIFSFKNISLSRYKNRRRSRLRFRGRGAALYLLLVVVSTLLKGFNRIIATGISVQREWRADGTAIEYCRDPVALAAGLYQLGMVKPKIAPVGNPYPVDSYREAVSSPAFESLLLVPFDSVSRQHKTSTIIDRLFHTHPPLEERINRHLKLAGEPYSNLVSRLENEQPSPDVPFRAMRDKEGNPLQQQKWWLHREGESREVSFLDLLTGKALDKETLLAHEKDEDWSSPDQHPEFSAIKKMVEADGTKENCPECEVPLCRRVYLGVPIKVCLACGGIALTWRQLVRLEARHRDGELPARLGKIEEYTGYHGSEAIPEDEITGGECPHCKTSFRTKRYRGTKLIVDQCTVCKLTWFREDELTIALNL